MKKDNEKNPNKILKIILNVILILILLVLIGITALYIYKNQKTKNSDENTLEYTELINEIVNKNVEKIENKKELSTEDLIKKGLLVLGKDL